MAPVPLVSNLKIWTYGARKAFGLIEALTGMSDPGTAREPSRSWTSAKVFIRLVVTVTDGWRDEWPNIVL